MLVHSSASNGFRRALSTLPLIFLILTLSRKRSRCNFLKVFASHSIFKAPRSTLKLNMANFCSMIRWILLFVASATCLPALPFSFETGASHNFTTLESLHRRELINECTGAFSDLLSESITDVNIIVSRAFWNIMSQKLIISTVEEHGQELGPSHCFIQR